jgi:large subunit ribosomal protein L22
MEAKAALMFAPQKSSEAIEKLLDSAVSNARQQGAAAEQLFVKTISVDKGTVMRRFSPKARGRAGAIRKTMSIVKLELGNRGAPAGAAPKKATKTEKAEKAPAKKRAAKKASK